MDVSFLQGYGEFEGFVTFTLKPEQFPWASCMAIDAGKQTINGF